MKRLVVSIALLVIVGSLCGVSLHGQQKNTHALIDTLDRMEQASQTGDRQRCRQLSENFPADFERRTRWFSLFLPHNYLSSVQEVAVTLPVILQGEDSAHFPIELARCRLLLQRLEQLEVPSMENIL